MQAIKRLALLVCALTVFAVPATANATITTKTIDYGPYTIPAGNGDPHDHENMGMITNQMSPTSPSRAPAARSSGSRRTSSTPTGPERRSARARCSTTRCSPPSRAASPTSPAPATGPGLLGERFFASGDERTAVDLTSLPYGYKVNSTETWNMVFDMMNWATTSKTVKIRMTWKYATGTDATSRAALRPVWLDQTSAR